MTFFGLIANIGQRHYFLRQCCGVTYIYLFPKHSIIYVASFCFQDICAITEIYIVCSATPFSFSRRARNSVFFLKSIKELVSASDSQIERITLADTELPDVGYTKLCYGKIILNYAFCC